MKPLFTLLFLALLSLQMQAQIFVKHDASGTNDGTSWANAYTNLQDALDDAVSGAQVWIAAGTYVPQGPTPDSSHFIATHPVQLYGGFAGTETTLTQRDWNTHRSIISGDKLRDDIPGVFTSNRTDNAHHVLIINAPETESVIDGLVFESGSARLDANNFTESALDIPYNRWSGGALYLSRSGAVIRNSLFHDNNGVRGSGIYAFGDTLHTISLQFDNVIIRNNNGYVGVGGYFQAFQDLQFTNTRVTGNSGSAGAGLYFFGSNTTVKSSVLDSNVANYGAAIMSFHSNLYIKHPETKVLNSSFTGNTASDWGGGLHVYNIYGSFSVQVDSSSFTGNSTGAGGFGAGIEIWDAQDALPVDPLSTINITNSEFIANTSTFGGGVEIETEDDSVKIVIENVKFEANNGIRGGGLNVYAYANSKSDVYVRNAEFTGNVASIAGGMSMEALNNTYPLTYLLEDCSFTGNIGQNGLGALNIQHHPRADGVRGTIRRTVFEDNHGVGVGGGFTVFHGNHLIEDSYFFANSTDATLDSLYHGGGAINIIGPAELSIDRSIFEDNTSLIEGAAITVNANVNVSIQNTLFHHHEGNSTIYNEGEILLLNTTIVENEGGLHLADASTTEMQNSIIDSDRNNVKFTGKPSIISHGGNLSSDISMTYWLTGSGDFQDINDADPLLGADYYPLAGSPLIDGGNITGIKTPTDLAGDPRVQGNTIDIGSYESLFTGINNPAWNTLQLFVFPSPVTDQLHFNLEDEWLGTIRIKMYDNLGRLVLHDTQVKTATVQQFSLSGLRLLPGEYLMMVQSNRKTYGNKVIVQ